MRRGRRRELITGAVIVAGLAAGAWWWSRPGDGWACVGGAAVECQRAVDVSAGAGAPDGEGWRLAFNSFDVAPDRAVVAAGFTRPADAGGEAAARLVIHDLTASIQPEPVTVAPDGQPLTYVEGANWSADGTRLAAYVRTAGDDHLVVLDRSARYVGDIPIADDGASCSWRVGLSADGTTVRCGDGLYDLASGRFVDTAPAEVDTAWGDQLGGGILLADDGTTVHSVGPGLTVDPGGQLVELPPGGGEGFRLALDPTGATLVAVDRLDAGPAWRQPRRSRAQGRIAWVDLASGAVTASAPVEAQPYDIDADLADGWTALLTADGEVLFLRPRA